MSVTVQTIQSAYKIKQTPSTSLRLFFRAIFTRSIWIYNHIAQEKAVGSCRLLRPDINEHGNLKWAMEVYELENRPEYVALSYTWGKDPAACAIQLNGCKMLIRSNLYHALEAIVVISHMIE